MPSGVEQGGDVCGQRLGVAGDGEETESTCSGEGGSSGNSCCGDDVDSELHDAKHVDCKVETVNVNLPWATLKEYLLRTRPWSFWRRR